MPEVNSGFTVQAHEVYSGGADDEPVFLVTIPVEGRPDFLFLNLGEIHAAAPTDGAAVRTSFESQAFGTFDNRGEITSSGATFAYGMDIPSLGPHLVYNSGTIEAVSANSAYGLRSYFGLLFHNQANGVVEVTATNPGTAYARGILLANSGEVINDGLIQVSGGEEAYGIQIIGFQNSGRNIWPEGGSPTSTPYGIVVNNGEILVEASAAPGSVSYGIAVTGLDLGYPLPEPTIVNRGTITADVAILAYYGGWSPFPLPEEWVLNEGTINGDVRLGAGDDIVENQGLIVGDVSLESGNNTYDGRGGGIVTGEISGLNENDTIWGGDAADSIAVNGGNDWVHGGAGDDYISTWAGDDFLTGGPGADTLLGGFSDNDLYEIDTANYADSGASVVVNLTSGMGSGGDAAGDTLTAIENLIGSAFSDTLTGNFNVNVLAGGDGNDALYGHAGADTLDGGGGNDLFEGGAGADAFVGGAGVDTVSYSRAVGAGVEVNLTLNRGIGGEAQGDTFDGVETIAGSAFADRITGTDAANFIYGLAGNDMLWGNAGNDILIGAAGADILTGGAGIDATSYHNSTTGVRVVLFQNQGFNGEAQGDRFGSIENIIGSPFNDEIFGDNANNELHGQQGADNLYGNTGNDLLEGGDGTDNLQGQDGNDTVSGGAGADRLIGGNGADSFFYRTAGESAVGNPDEIVDFTRAHGDKINLMGIDANTGVGGDQAFSFIGAAAFSGVAGQLRYAANLLEGDVNGDGAADFQIEVNVASMLASDFWL